MMKVFLLKIDTQRMTVGVLVELVLRKCTLCRIYHVGTVVVDLPQFF